MTKKQIEEGTKLLDEFIEDAESVSGLGYHSDWRMLMPVIQKIHNYDYVNDINIAAEYTFIEPTSPDRKYISIDSKHKEPFHPMTTFRAAVQFVEWFNHQKEG